jgi:endogenous inhibitor of DNA gyrase (YacG/DUF329 family)
MADQQDRSATCVFCRRRPADPAWRPFCSERCKIQDLARWAEGAYRVPGEPVGEPDNPASPRVTPRDDGS